MDNPVTRSLDPGRSATRRWIVSGRSIVARLPARPGRAQSRKSPPSPPAAAGFQIVIVALEKKRQAAGQGPVAVFSLPHFVRTPMTRLPVSSGIRRRVFVSALGAIYLNAKLFAHIEDAVYPARDTGAGCGKPLRVLGRYHLDFVRWGARLKSAKPETAQRHVGRSNGLCDPEFSQNGLADDRIHPAAGGKPDGRPAATLPATRPACNRQGTQDRRALSPLPCQSSNVEKPARSLPTAAYASFCSRPMSRAAAMTVTHNNEPTIAENPGACARKKAQLLGGIKVMPTTTGRSTMASTPQHGRAPCWIRSGRAQPAPRP